METKLSIVKKVKEVKMMKRFNNNKGFSLIELLIVIAIMGVLAVIAFNMFGGVLLNSKKRADDQQARNIEKAILTYCVDSGDWGLQQMSKTSGGTAETVVTGTSKNLLGLMMIQTYNTKDGKTYGPLLSLKDPEKAVTDPVNASAYDPQWSKASGGKYEGWLIQLYPSKQTVKVSPTETSGTDKVSFGTGESAPS